MLIFLVQLIQVDGQLRCQGPDRGELFVRPDGPGDNQLAQPILDLLVNRPGVPVVEVFSAEPAEFVTIS